MAPKATPPAAIDAEPLPIQVPAAKPAAEPPAAALEIDEPGSSLPFLQEHFEMYREAPVYMSGSNEIAELLLEIPARYNRFVFYSGDLPHSAHIPHPELLSTDFAKGRLTLNCFASVRPR